MDHQLYIFDSQSERNNPLYFWGRFDMWHAWLDFFTLAETGGHPYYRKGCVYTSVRRLADRWQWSAKKVRGFLKKLDTLGRIDIREEPKGDNDLGCYEIIFYARNMSMELIYRAMQHKTDPRVLLN